MAEKSAPICVQKVLTFLDCLDAFDELCQSDNDAETVWLETPVNTVAEPQTQAVDDPPLLDDDYNPRKRKCEKPANYLKDSTNPMEMCDDEEFVKIYRFSKSTVKDIADMIMYGLTSSNNRGQPVPPIVKLLIVLRYLATGKCFNSASKI